MCFLKRTMKIKANLVEWPASNFAMCDVRMPHNKPKWAYRILHCFWKRDGIDATDNMCVHYQEIDAKGKVKMLKKEDFHFETYWSQKCSQV